MSKELVISASSHERRVAILEEGQLVEIYIEREKEFALVGSIYKGKVTRVLPGMQSAFVDIGLDGDAFLYVSDVFENLEDYDHGHAHDAPPAPVPAVATNAAALDVLPGETLARASESRGEESTGEPPVSEASRREEFGHEEIHLPGETRQGNGAETQHEFTDDERQPESNASAPPNFSPSYNPTQNYPSPNNRGGDRGFDRGNDRGGGFDRGGRGRFGRRAGGRRGGRPGPGGRNLPPSKYASPQGGESRGYDNRGRGDRGPNRGPDRGPSRGYDQRGRYDNRRQDSGRPAGPAPQGPAGIEEEPILLPGESLAKYRGKPQAAPVTPVVEQEEQQPQPNFAEPLQPQRGVGPVSTNAPRRSSGGLPRWLLADAGSEAEATTASDESAIAEENAAVAASEAAEADAEVERSEANLSDDDVKALSSSLIEARQEEAQEEVEVDSVSGGAVFEEEDEQDQEEVIEEEAAASAEEAHEAEHEAEEEVHPAHAHAEAEAEAEAAHEDAEHLRALGENIEAGSEADHDAESEGSESEDSESEDSERLHEHEDDHEHQPELIEAAADTSEPPLAAAAADDDSILLPGETRAPRGAGAPREEFRDSARIGGNPRSRFQRPFRGGGRDRGRDNRGGRPERRPGDRGGRPSGRRFDRRGYSGGGQNRGYRQGSHSGPPRRPQLISEMLKAGQEVVVQIAKEPLGKKGARITSHVALPGRFLVYMPTIDHIGVSRKIASAENRSRLRRLVGEARGAYPGGFIVRTAAGGATDDEIRTDIEFLGKTWNEIKQKHDDRKAPSLLHRDLNLVERILRDYVSDDFTAIWIDNEEEYGKVVEFVSRFQPKLASRVKLYTKEQPIFEEFGIQHELDKALRAKVWLKSGGYIVINHTEALVAIDVNTGKFVGKGSTRLEDTIVKTNLEAVKEIVRQIRLRDLGGIIVVDFIDMEERRNREKVLGALQQALDQDKAPSKALSFNEFGLVCITRKRTKQALERVLCQPCPYCTGSGMVKSIPTLCYEIQAEARKMAVSLEGENPNLTLRVNPEIAKALKTRESMLIDELEQNAHKHIIIQSDATLHWEQYDIY